MKKMIKNVGLAISLGLFSLTGFGQTQVGNAGFENWDSGTGDGVEPTNWNSFMSANCTLGGLICGQAQKKQVEKSTDAHSGTYSARIWSRDATFAIANGNLTVGQVNMGSTTAANANNYNFSKRSDANFSEAFTGKPDSLVVWIKYTPVTATDQARISATIHDDYDYRDPEDANATPHVVAKAELDYGKTNGWKRLSIPFIYSGQATTPAYILITFTTNKTPGGGKANDEVLIDDLEMIYNVPTVAIAPTAVQNILEGQNGTQLTATETNGTVTSREWKYSTTSGSGYVSFAPTQTGATYTPNFATQGTYYVVCVSDFGGAIKTSNEVKINVTKDVSVYNAVASNIAVFGFDKVVTIDLTNVDVENATISILDMAGKKIATSALTSKSVNTINLPSTTANGVYMYQIEGKGVIKTGKLAF